MLWNDLDESARPTNKNGPTSDSELGSSGIYRRVVGNTTHALHVPELSMFESFVKEPPTCIGDSLFTCTAAQSCLNADKTNGQMYTQCGDSTEARAKYMRYFQPSLDSQLYQDTQVMSLPVDQGVESQLSLDVELPSELFSQVNDHESQRVFKLFGEVIATKPNRPLKPKTFEKHVRLRSPLIDESNSPSRSRSIDADLDKVCVPNDDSYLNDLSTNLKQILDNPFKFNSNDDSMRPTTPSKLANFRPIANLTGIGEFSPIKLVEYSSSENEETFAKPKLPAAPKFKSKPIEKTKLHNFDDISNVNQSKLQSTFMDRKQPTAVTFNSPLNISVFDKHNHITPIRKDVAQTVMPDISPRTIEDDKLTEISEFKNSDSISKENWQPKLENNNGPNKNDYNILVDRQRLYLINLKKELLRMQRLERLFAQLSTKHDNCSNVPIKPSSKGQALNDEQIKVQLNDDARRQIELSVNRGIVKVMQNSPNLSNIPASVLSPYLGKENRLRPSSSADSFPSNSSYIGADNVSCTSSKASYELSEACSQIKSILNDSSDFVSGASNRSQSPVKMLNETFVKSTLCLPESLSNSPAKSFFGSDFRRLSLDQSKEQTSSGNLFVSTAKMDDDAKISNLPNTMTLEEMFRRNRPQVYAKIVQRSLQLSLDCERRRQTKQLQADNPQLEHSNMKKSQRSLALKLQSSPNLVEIRNRPKPDMKQVRQQTAQRYLQLPEVQRRRRERERQEQIRTNRLMAQAYNAKLKQQLLRHQQQKQQNPAKHICHSNPATNRSYVKLPTPVQN